MKKPAASTDAPSVPETDSTSEFTGGGLLGVLRAKPLPDELIDATALLAARLVLICAVTGYTSVHVFGAYNPSVIFNYHLPIVAFIGALSLAALPIPGRIRVLLTAVGLCIIALVQFRLQNNPLFSLFVLTPLSTLMLVAYGGKAALSRRITSRMSKPSMRNVSTISWGKWLKCFSIWRLAASSLSLRPSSRRLLGAGSRHIANRIMTQIVP